MEIKDWNKLKECSTGLKNVLLKRNALFGTVVEDIDERMFLMTRGAGVKKWNEFVKLKEEDSMK